MIKTFIFPMPLPTLETYFNSLSFEGRSEFPWDDDWRVGVFINGICLIIYYFTPIILEENTLLTC